MIKDEYKLSNKLQIIQWCAYDLEFKAIDKGFKSWISKGITTYYSLTENGQFKSFDGLKEDCDLDRTEFFRFLQVRSHFEHIRKETDLNDPISKFFIDAYQRNQTRVSSPEFIKAYSLKSSTIQIMLGKNEREREICSYLKRIGSTFANPSGNAPALIHGESSVGSVWSISSLCQNKRHILLEGRLRVGGNVDTGKPIIGISFGNARWLNPFGQSFIKY